MIQYNHVTAGSTTNYLSIYPYSAGGGFLCLNAAGNVGIGTTAPAGNVSIYGSSYPSIIIQDSVNTSEYITMFRDHIANISLIRATGRIDIETPPNYNRMTILGNGNVGIGKTIPTAALDVTGSLFINNGAVATSPSAFQGMQMAYVGTGSTGYGYILCTNPGATWNSLCLNPFGGNVGIGLTNPSSKLDVAGAINCTSFLVNGTAVATGTGSVWGVNGSSAYYTSGNVGIGTISPTASLHINNASGNRLNMLYLSSIQSGIVLDSTASSNGRSYNIWSTNGSDSVGSGCLAFFDIISSTYRMIINPSGNVGIGTNNPAFTLTVYGGAGIGYNAGGNNPYISSPTLTIQNTANYGAVCAWFERDVIAGGAIGTFSDIRIKNNIKPAINLLDKINQITIVSHGFIDPFKTPSETSIAVIAQDIINVIPDAVMFNKEVIPNIMQVPISCILLDDIVVITCSNSMDINVNDTVQLILASGNKDCTVSYISDDRKIIYVPKWDNINLLNDQIFIYGKYVNDFHIVDKPKLGLLALGGVKELHQIIKEQQTQINQLIHRLAAANIA
jgi:hypothetical protein